MKKIINYILRKAGLEQISVFIGYLKASGWFKSVLGKSPIDSDGTPLPWYSYPCIHFLEKHIRTGSLGITVFEYGSGNSTLWWANRTKQVVSVEDDKNWYDRVKKIMPENVTYTFAEGESEYVSSITRYPTKFDVVIVDGSHREECIKVAKDALTELGVIIVDNSDWESLRSAIGKLTSTGFNELEFNGLGPCNGHPWSTTILYRSENFLKI